MALVLELEDFLAEPFLGEGGELAGEWWAVDDEVIVGGEVLQQCWVVEEAFMAGMYGVEGAKVCGDLGKPL